MPFTGITGAALSARGADVRGSGGPGGGGSVAEAWRKVPACRWFGLPAGVFEGSSEGRAKVLGEVRAGTPDKDGYLRLKYLGRWFSVAVIVALAFHGPPEVRHLDGNRQNNKPGNLAWGSRRDNERDKRENRRKENIGHRPVPPRTS